MCFYDPTETFLYNYWNFQAHKIFSYVVLGLTKPTPLLRSSDARAPILHTSNCISESETSSASDSKDSFSMSTRSHHLRNDGKAVNRIPESDADDTFGELKLHSSLRESDDCFTTRPIASSRDVSINSREKKLSRRVVKTKSPEPVAPPSSPDSDADEHLEDYFAQLRSTIKKKPQPRERAPDSSPPVNSRNSTRACKKKSLDSFIVSDSESVSIHDSMVLPDSSSSIVGDSKPSKTHAIKSNPRDPFDYRAADVLLRLPLSERISHYNHPASDALNFKWVRSSNEKN